jgi:hypothetical protein
VGKWSPRRRRSRLVPFRLSCIRATGGAKDRLSARGAPEPPSWCQAFNSPPDGDQGPLRYDDVHTFLEAVRNGRAISFRKLVDVREGSTEVSQTDSMSFAGMLSALSSRADGAEGHPARAEAP